MDTSILVRSPSWKGEIRRFGVRWEQGYSPIFGLFVQDYSCWTQWNQHNPRLIPCVGFAPRVTFRLGGVEV